MSKAFVIKNKEGKYFGYYDSENNRFEFSKKPKRFIMFNTLRDANKIKNFWKMNKCEVVEITIAEGDLEQENKQLKEQLAIREKALELACETITEEGCDNCEFRFNCKKYDGGSTLEDCKNTFIEQAKESLNGNRYK